jgi:hypothetical protein
MPDCASPQPGGLQLFRLIEGLVDEFAGAAIVERYARRLREQRHYA